MGRSPEEADGVSLSEDALLISLLMELLPTFEAELKHLFFHYTLGGALQPCS